MTPVELELAAAARQNRRALALEWADTLAWLAGGYAALGVHAPQRFPRQPNGVHAARAMTDEEMKRAALAFAAHNGGGTEHGHDA